ncbi:unnamed protein product [Anisakis simplex]|uniref:Uncharacterized protein n=1 Tax=Anisakis simplex TaxID=6269 RepID=A0A0M3KHL3_ANISI|nr:unnamed protein product [Anisakis simplex]
MAPNADVVTAASREPPRAIVFETFDDGNQASSRRRSSYDSRKRSTAAELATRSINATANSTSFDVFQQTNTRKPSKNGSYENRIQCSVEDLYGSGEFFEDDIAPQPSGILRRLFGSYSEQI